MQSTRTISWDRIGAWTGGACAIHCFALSLAAALLPMLGMAGLHSPAVDWIFLSVAAIVGPLAMITGYRRHGKWQPSALFITGLALIIAAHFLIRTSSTMEAMISALGGCCLLSFHLLNARLSHRAACHCGQCPH